jgi:hypothetical protein
LGIIAVNIVMSIIRLVSIDIGKINFAQYIEDFESDVILSLEKKYKNLPKNLQRRTRGHMNTQVWDILLDVVLSGLRVQTGVYNFTTDETDKYGERLWDNAARLNLIKHLHSFEYLWDTCDVFVIEQQYFNATAFGGKKKAKSSSGANVDAIKIAEATYMWFLNKYPFKTIMYFGSQYKTQIFGAPFKLDKPGRKKWATNIAKEFYTLKEDEDMINLFDLAEAVKRKQIKTEERVLLFKSQYPCESEDAEALSTKIICEKQKLDDSSDCFIQAQAFKFKTMVACF